MFGRGNLIFVDLKWNKYISLRNFQHNFNSEQRFGVDQYL